MFFRLEKCQNGCFWNPIDGQNYGQAKIFLSYKQENEKKQAKKGEELWVIASSFPSDWSDQSVSCNGIVYLPDKELRRRQADLCR